ncbi:hypothetical protein [Acinetobacter faecalis]|uniref:hypothetical protein n=1 Tax=Acinetobacter faecalis TaxID=2665161 RepID=UPI002A90D890|nr:hypothetical protein [Acinetobacter faecalis]MDY6451592.1 hypothetical protein [Acinetobacter faecalis]
MQLEFDEIKNLINICFQKVENTKEYLLKKNVRQPYLEMVDKILNEINLFNNNLHNTLNNFEKDIYIDNPIFIKDHSIDEKKRIRIDYEKNIDLEMLKEYNLNLENRIKNLKINSLGEHFEDDIYFYEYLNEILNEINRLRLDFLKFYRNFRNGKSGNLVKMESDFYNYIDNRVNKVDRYFKKIEEKLKNIDVDYDESLKNIDKMNNTYMQLSSNVSNIYNDINVLNENLVQVKKNTDEFINSSILNFEAELISFKDQMLISMKSHLDDLELDKESSQIKISSYIDGIGKTSRKFNEFISDETSIKLTDNFKAKASTEKKWYYVFNATSAIIIGVAIWMSYSSLTEFAKNHAEDFTQLDLYYLAIRLLFSFLIFATVAFTNKLANKHYYHWKKNESTYLKLTALKSFIADMSPEKQQEIHEKLIDVYFGKEDLDPTIYRKLDNSNNDLIKFFTDKGVSLVSAKKNE